MCYIQYLLCTHMHRICMYIHVYMDILYVIFSIKSSKLIYTIGRSSTNLNKVQIHSKNLREQGKLLMLSTQNVLTKLVFQRLPYLRIPLHYSQWYWTPELFILMLLTSAYRRCWWKLEAIDSYPLLGPIVGEWGNESKNRWLYPQCVTLWEGLEEALLRGLVGGVGVGECFQEAVIHWHLQEER